MISGQVYHSQKKEDIVDRSGRVLGQHDGVHRYTIGQRKDWGLQPLNRCMLIELDAGRNR